MSNLIEQANQLYSGVTKVLSESNAALALKEVGSANTLIDIPAKIGEIKTGVEDWYKDVFAGTLTEIEDDTVTVLSGSAFIGCKDILSASFSKVTRIDDWEIYGPDPETGDMEHLVLQPNPFGMGCFSACTKLATVIFPKLEVVGSGAFAFCLGINTISLPQATTIGSNAFNYCSALNTISLPQATTIGVSAFDSCSALNTIILPNEERVVELTGELWYNYSKPDAFQHIYVPQSMVYQYQSATNWSKYSQYITGYDYPEEVSA